LLIKCAIYKKILPKICNNKIASKPVQSINQISTLALVEIQLKIAEMGLSTNTSSLAAISSVMNVLASTEIISTANNTSILPTIDD